MNPFSKRKKDATTLDEKLVRKTTEKVFKKEKEKLDELTEGKNLIISLYGDVNAGKSSTINCLTGKNFAEASAHSGSTTDIKLYPYSENVFIADTPGLSDINEENSKKSESYVHENADVVLFFFKATGVTKPEFEALKNIAKTKKPIIAVLNYIDIWCDGNKLIEQHSLDTVVKQISSEIERILAELRMPENNIPVIPISAKKEINIEMLNTRIADFLQENGKDLLYLKVAQHKGEQVRKWINGASVTAAGIGAIPVPGADIIHLTSLQVGLALKIAYIHNCKITKEDVMQLLASTITVLPVSVWKLSLFLRKSRYYFC